ncbi:MAG: hypothetical protein AB7V43_00790 [Acidimicrobiia bacterium]
MIIELDTDQIALLRELLDHEYRNLKYEIADTDSSEFRAALKARREVLRSVLDLTGGPLPDQS